MLELSKKDMMLPYGGIITRILKAYDIPIPPEEVIKVDRFSIINKNLLHRLRCVYRNGNWVRMPRRTDPPQPKPEPETPVFRGTQSPLICPLEETHSFEQAPASSIEDIGIRMDRFEQREDRFEQRQDRLEHPQDQILSELQQIHRQFDSLFRHFNFPPPE